MKTDALVPFLHLFSPFIKKKCIGIQLTYSVSFRCTPRWLQLYIHMLFFSFSFRVAPKAYGRSQARGPIGAVAADLHRSHSSTGSEPSRQPRAHSNARSLIHWVRPGMEPPSSWIPVGFITTEPQWKLHKHSFWDSFPLQVITRYWVYFPGLYSRSQWLSILYTVICICYSQTPNFSLHTPFSLW